jgi:hypothetical protein
MPAGPPVGAPPAAPTQTVPSVPIPSPIEPASAQTSSLVISGGVLSYEQAQAQLAAHGVTWQRLETTGDNSWKFSCSVPNPQNKFISRTYEGQARDYLSAMRAVLDQIAKER